MPSPLHFFMSDLLLNVHSVTAATIVVDNARSSQKTTTILPASMSSTISRHSCSRWEWCIEQPISMLASSSSTTHSSSSSTSNTRTRTTGTSLPSDDRSSLPPLQRRAPLVISNHSIPTCPQRQLSRDINDDGSSNDTNHQDPHRPSIATISSMYAAAAALPTTPTYFQSRLQIKISPPRGTIEEDASSIMMEDDRRPIRQRLSKTLGSVYTVTSAQAPTCPVRRQSPAPRHAAFRLPMMDEERDSSMDILPPMPPFLTSCTTTSRTTSTTMMSSAAVSSSCTTEESDSGDAAAGTPSTDISLRGPPRRGPRSGGMLLPPCFLPICNTPPPPPCSSSSSEELVVVHHKRAISSSSSSGSSSSRSVVSASVVGDRQ
jgi:hypothetical protein